eukprot:gene13862-16346_t
MARTIPELQIEQSISTQLVEAHISDKPWQNTSEAAKLKEALEQIASGAITKQIEGTCTIRRIVSIQSNPHLDLVLSSGVLPLLLQFFTTNTKTESDSSLLLKPRPSLKYALRLTDLLCEFLGGSENDVTCAHQALFDYIVSNGGRVELLKEFIEESRHLLVNRGKQLDEGVHALTSLLAHENETIRVAAEHYLKLFQNHISKALLPPDIDTTITTTNTTAEMTTTTPVVATETTTESPPVEMGIEKQ